MAARPQIVAAALLAAVLSAIAAPAPGQDGRGQAKATRIVSLVPALTEMLFAIGAGAQVVGVSSYDEYPPAVTSLPRVGALVDPNSERIFALRPDLVITYGSQTQLPTQFANAGIRTFSYRHGGIDVVLQTIRDLGAATGHAGEASQLAARMQASLEGVRARVAGRRRPRTLLVFERQPDSLREVYASGGRGFLHELLTAAGASNVFGDVARESVQPSQETLIARAPEVILEVRSAGLIQDQAATPDRNPWFALASLPAVRHRRIHFLSGGYLVIPGPRLVQAAESFARVLHPEAFAR